MERRDLILNNDLSTMLAYENRQEQHWDEDWEKEHQQTMREADKIISSPNETIDAKDIMQRTARHVGADEYYMKLYIDGSDEEQLAVIRDIEYTANYTVLTDAIYMAGNTLIEKNDYAGWCNILYALRYVPLQKCFCFDLKSDNNYIGILNTIDAKQLVYPQTFFRMLLDHWFEWLWMVGGRLLSYEDPRGNFRDNEKAQKLKEEAGLVRREWELNISGRICDMLHRLLVFLDKGEMLIWATQEPMRCTMRNNEFDKAHDKYLKLIWKTLIDMGALQSSQLNDVNLNLLTLLAEEYTQTKDVKRTEEIDKLLKQRLLEENFTGMGVLTPVDEERQSVIARFLQMRYPSLQDADEYVKSIAPCYQGWNLDYQQLYKEARREAYVFCCLMRRPVDAFSTDKERLEDWKGYIDLYVREYKRCDNEYISRDELTMPFKMAAKIAEEHQIQECKDYLYGAMIDNVLSIVSLLSIFISCKLWLTGETIVKLNKRIEAEWPSARMLMEIRGQKALRDGIDQLVEKIKQFVEERKE